MFVLDITWKGVTPELYDAAKAQVDWVNNPDPHGLFHFAWFDGTGLRCLDIWDDETAFNNFIHNRLAPVTTSLGINTWPEVQTYTCHDTFVLQQALAGAR
jgi:hypothetical protein